MLAVWVHGGPWFLGSVRTAPWRRGAERPQARGPGPGDVRPPARSPVPPHSPACTLSPAGPHSPLTVQAAQLSLLLSGASLSVDGGAAPCRSGLLCPHVSVSNQAAARSSLGLSRVCRAVVCSPPDTALRQTASSLRRRLAGLARSRVVGAAPCPRSSGVLRGTLSPWALAWRLLTTAVGSDIVLGRDGHFTWCLGHVDGLVRVATSAGPKPPRGARGHGIGSEHEGRGVAGCSSPRGGCSGQLWGCGESAAWVTCGVAAFPVRSP